jgi:hypothetical protein
MLIFYVLLFGVVQVNLARCDFVMVPTKEQHQILSRSQKKCDGDHANDYTSVQG